MSSNEKMARMFLPAIFWAVIAYHIAWFAVRQIVSLHMALEPNSAQVIWAFLLDITHPAYLTSVGFVELAIGWLCFMHFKRNGLADDLLQPGRFGTISIVATVTAFVFLPDIIFGFIAQWFVDPESGVAEIYRDGYSGNFQRAQLAGVFLAAVVIAPVMEELLFRGALVTTMQARGISAPAIVLLSSLGFAWLHWQYALLGLIFVFLTGVGLCLLRLWSGGLVLPMVGHFAFNLKFFLITYAQLYAPPST